MKKFFLGSALLLAVAACNEGNADSKETEAQKLTPASATTGQEPDTSQQANQVGSTGNGGVGTGATNQTGESSSGTGAVSGGTGAGSTSAGATSKP